MTYGYLKVKVILAGTAPVKIGRSVKRALILIMIKCLEKLKVFSLVVSFPGFLMNVNNTKF